MTTHRGEYPANWPEIAQRVKDEAGWKCERCGHPNDAATNHVLTVHHLDGDKSNIERWNLAALCQRCHLSVQARVDWHQVYMLEHSPWMKPHVEAFLAWMERQQPPVILNAVKNLPREPVSDFDIRISDLEGKP